MNTKTANLVCAAFIAALIGYIVYIYPDLPDPMPTHWDAAGRANGFMSRLSGVLAFASIPIFGVLLFKIIPVISPRGYRTDLFADVVNALMVGVVVFGSVIGVVALNAALGSGVNINTAVFVSIGLLLIFMGNYMGKFRKNFFIGIRTPWTLASDEVWVKTHRLGGWCFVAAGIVMLVSAFAKGDSIWIVLLVVGFALIPVVYSYFAYRALEGFGPDPEIEDDSNSES
jgi:uncharacterized membrane protein